MATGDRQVSTCPESAERKVVLTSLFAVYLIWGSTYLAIRVAVREIPPLMMAGVRFLLAGAGLYAFVRLRGSAALNRRQWLGAAIAGTLMLSFGNGGLTVAEKSVSSGLAAAVVASVPLWAAVFAGFWGQWPTRAEWLGLALGFAGVVILCRGAELRANPTGALILLAASASFALGAVWTRYLHLPSGLMGSACSQSRCTFCGIESAVATQEKGRT